FGDAPIDRVAGGAATLGVSSLICVPLVIHEDVLGCVTLARSPPSATLTPADRALVAEIARRAATCVENPRLFRSRERAVRMREDMLSTVSHDLRGPLGVILMASTQVAQQDLPSEDLTKSADLIRRSADRMLRLVNDLLDLAQVDTGHLRLERRNEK